MITTWMLTFWIDTGFFGYHRHDGIEFSSKQDCMEQVEAIKSQVKSSGNRLNYAYCYPKEEGKD